MRSIARSLCCLLIMLAVMPCFVPSADAASYDVSLKLTLSEPSVIAEGTVKLEAELINSNADNKEISDFSFQITYDSANLTYSGMETKADGLSASGASSGRIAVTYSAPKEDKCVKSGEKYTFIFTAADRFSAQKATFSADHLNASMRKSFSTASLISDNIKYAFTASSSYPAVSLLLTPRSNNAELADLVPMIDGTAVKLTPEFSPDVTEYSVEMEYDSCSFSFYAATPADPLANVFIKWPQSLEVGANAVNIVVTGQDKINTKTYIVIVNLLPEGESTTREAPVIITGEQPVSSSDASATDVPEEPETEPEPEPEPLPEPVPEPLPEEPAADEGVPKMSFYIALAVAAASVLAAVGGIGAAIGTGIKYRKKLAESEERVRSLSQQLVTMYYVAKKQSPSKNEGK